MASCCSYLKDATYLLLTAHLRKIRSGTDDARKSRWCSLQVTMHSTSSSRIHGARARRGQCRRLPDRSPAQPGMFRPRGTAGWEKPARFAARSTGNTLSTGRTVLPWSSPTPETRINELGNSAVISLPAPPTPDCNGDVLLPEELVARGGGEQAFTTELTICLDNLPRLSAGLGARSLVSVAGISRCLEVESELQQESASR